MSNDTQSDSNDGQRGPGAWIAAAILIAVGLLFLLQNLGYSLPGNWWALFLFIPAAGSLASAFRLWQRAGHYTSSMNGPLIAAAVFVALAIIFLLDLDVPWGLVWPAAAILLGIAMLGRVYSRR